MQTSKCYFQCFNLYIHVFEQKPLPPKENILKLSICFTVCHLAQFFCISWLLKRGYLGYSFPFYQLEQSDNSALTSGMFSHRTAAHWMFSLFKNILCKHQRWFCRKISPAHLALILYILALPVLMLGLNLDCFMSE